MIPIRLENLMGPLLFGIGTAAFQTEQECRFRDKAVASTTSTTGTVRPANVCGGTKDRSLVRADDGDDGTFAVAAIVELLCSTSSWRLQPGKAPRQLGRGVCEKSKVFLDPLDDCCHVFICNDSRRIFGGRCFRGGGSG